MPRPFAKVRGVFERPKGSGIWWIRYADQYGQRHREKIGPRSLAIEAYRKRKAEVQEGIYFSKKRKRLALLKEIAQDFLAYSKANKRSAKDDEYRLNYCLSAFGDREAAGITPQDIERHKEALAQNHAQATVNRYLATIKTAYSLAVRNGKVEKNPVKAVRLFTENNARVRYLTEDEEGWLLDVLPGHFKPLVVLAIHTGLRRGELINLRWEDIDFRTATITVRRSKHGESRHVPVNRVALQTLLAMRRERKVLAPYIFTTAASKYLHNFERTWIATVKKAGIENLRFHDLRHTFGSRLAMRGIPLRTIQELMGHKTIAMTLRYAHLSPGHLRQAVEGLCEGVIQEQRGTIGGTEKIACFGEEG